MAQEQHLVLVYLMLASCRPAACRVTYDSFGVVNVLVQGCGVKAVF